MARMRWQLFEIHDQTWFPDFLRREVLDALQMVLERTNAYNPIAGRLRGALDRAGTREVLDLFSGAGGPWPSLVHSYKSQGGPALEVFLTDKFPRAAEESETSAAESQIHFVARPLDATDPSAFPSGFRTIFSSFHHFNPAEARRFLQDGAAKQQGIGVFEVASRRAFTLLVILFVPLLDWIYTPLRRPFRWSRLFWTYVVPVVPLVLLVDGLISCLRAYSLNDLRALTTGLEGSAPPKGPRYEWQIGEERSGRLPLRVTYLIGCPK